MTQKSPEGQSDLADRPRYSKGQLSRACFKGKTRSDRSLKEKGAHRHACAWRPHWGRHCGTADQAATRDAHVPHQGASPVCTARLPTLFPANAPGKGLDEAPGSRLWSGPDSAVAAIWGGNQWMEGSSLPHRLLSPPSLLLLCPFLTLCLSNKQVNEQISLLGKRKLLVWSYLLKHHENCTGTLLGKRGEDKAWQADELNQQLGRLRSKS